ncbi:Ankyrin repeat domain-containing protein 13A [Taenia solium]|eukprot:TsM_000149000 transcript=TsM_000149000 gene=TsM_000149000
MCPSDICRVWKQGPNVRIDASLIGFNGTSSWVRGNMSYIFRITVDADIYNPLEEKYLGKQLWNSTSLLKSL